jgi:hypothetical protein
MKIDIKALSTDLTAKLGNFQTRQRILMVFAVVAGVFLLFYWTAAAVSSQQAKSANYAADTQLRLADVQRFIMQRQSTMQSARVLRTGLMSHVQNIKAKYGLPGDIVNIRLVNSSGDNARQEQVSFRAENMIYQEFITILTDLEQYDNVWVKSVSVTKRFDNTQRIDITFDVIRGE